MNIRLLLTRSIGTRFLVLTIAMVVIIFGTLGAFIAQQNASALRASLHSKSTSVADLASRTGAENMTNYNYAALDLLVENIAKDADVVFVGFYNDKKELVTKRQMPASLVNVQMTDHELKDPSDAIVGTLKIGYRKDTVSRSLQNSIIILVSGTLAAIVIFSFGISIASRRMILNPVNSLCASIEKVAKGDLSQWLEAASNDEIGTLTSSLNGMVRNLNQMVRKVDSAADEINGIKSRNETESKMLKYLVKKYVR